MTKDINNYIDTYYNQPAMLPEEQAFKTPHIGDVVTFDITECFFYEMQDSGMIPQELEYEEYYILGAVEGDDVALLNVTDQYSLETHRCPLEILISVEY